MYICTIHKNKLCTQIHAAKTLEELIIADGVRDIDLNILRRASLRFSSQVLVALMEQSSSLAVDVYFAAKALPSTATQAQFLEQDDLVLNGCLLEGNEGLTICFKKTVPKVMKSLDERDVQRLEANKEYLQHPYIVQFEIVGTRHILMPFHPSTLEHMSCLLPGCELQLWQSMESALTSLHNNSLAHMDVKPSNILITYDGSFVLGDLDNISAFGSRAKTTVPYIPKDLQVLSYIADSKVDWWMLAMIFAEKVTDLEISSPSSAPTRKKLQQRLAEDQRMLGVWCSLASLLK